MPSRFHHALGRKPRDEHGCIIRKKKHTRQPMVCGVCGEPVVWSGPRIYRSEGSRHWRHKNPALDEECGRPSGVCSERRFAREEQECRLLIPAMVRVHSGPSFRKAR